MSAHEGNRIVPAVFFALFWCLLFFIAPYHLAFKEQLCLFACSPASLASLFTKPAALAILSGDFLTQFFLYPAIAATITVLVASAFWCAIGRDIPSLLPVAAELILSINFEYPLAATVGVAAAAWTAYGCLHIDNKVLRLTVTALCALLCYPLFGAGAFVFFVLLAFGQNKSFIPGLLTVLAGTAVIVAEGWFYLLPLNQTITYPLISGYHIKHTYLILCVPAVLALSLALRHKRISPIIWSCAACMSAPAILLFAADAKEEYDLKISTLAYCGKWDKVEDLSRKDKFDSQTAAYYRNLASARKGTLAEDLLENYQPLVHGLFLQVNGDTDYIKILASTDALMECGDYAQAQHSAMLAMTFSPFGKSSRATRRLAEAALANGDTAAASRYAELLSGALMHRKWAGEVIELCKEADSLNLSAKEDIFFFINDFTAPLRNILDSEPFNDTALQYLLCYDLLAKDISSFKSDYDRYYLPLNTGKSAPVIYQEALAMLDAGPAYMISPETDARNQDFLNGNHQAHQKSYWYYFLYAKPAE